MLARALALEPDVLLLDEPTSALDEARARRRGADTGRAWTELSMVIVTHDRGQAERLAGRIVRIQDGRVA